MSAALKRHCWSGLTIILAAFYLTLGVAIGGRTGVVAIEGMILIGSSVAARTRSTALAGTLLVVGSLPLAALTWWSAVTPVLAALVLICGGIAISTARQAPSVTTS
jgi:hypothetical protein